MENYGFILEESKEMEEISSLVSSYVHEKTGAKVLHISNKDDNKLFSIAFRTPPKDNTGVFHIIEHSVLSGSRKYKTKDPFVSLYSFSLATFMNAMTFTDITMYPFSSRNESDFYNLMDMYLDSVFFPAMYQNPEIFYKEGWHYEINSKDEKLKYNGVVYNEMKGVFSNRISQLYYKACKTHFMRHSYSFNSGGDPENIPDLTYKEFLETHKKYYHPSNSFVVLYGDMEISKCLKLLDIEYFSKFDKKELDIAIETEKPNKSEITSQFIEQLGETKEIIGDLKENVKMRVKSTTGADDFYSISADDNTSKSLFAIGYSITEEVDILDSFVINILYDILVTSPASPLREAIIEKGFAKEMYPVSIKASRNDFFIFFEDIEKEKKDELIAIVDETIKDMIDKGIDKKLLESSIRQIEMEWKEANFRNSHGLFYLFKMIDFWYYGVDPFEIFDMVAIIKELKRRANSRFFENFIKNHFFETGFRSYTILIPEKNLNEKREKALEERLAKYKSSCDNKKIDELIEINQKLHKRAMEEDEEEAKKTIPLLKLEDVKKDIWNCNYNIEENNDFTLLHVNMFSSDIIYFDFAFDIDGIKEEDIPIISFLTDLLTQIDTKKYSYMDLNKEIALHTGGVSFFPEVIENKKTHKISLRIVLNVKSIFNEAKELFLLLDEIIFNTLFDDEKRIKEILESNILKMESNLVYNGHSVVCSRISSYFLEVSKYASILGGFDYLRFLQCLYNNFDDRIEDLKMKLKELYKVLFKRNNLVISISASSLHLSNIRENINNFVLNLPKLQIEKSTSLAPLKKLNEGITCESNVLYVGKGYDIEKLGYKYSGKLLVLSNVLNGGYIHNNVRAKGGAYGGSIKVYSNKALIASSYRDPNLLETLSVYDDISKYLESFKATKVEMTSYIIGSLKEFYTPIFPESEAIRALRLYLSGRTNEDIMQILDEALVTSENDIKSYSVLLQKVMEKNYICVLGNEKKIKDAFNIFSNIISLK